MTKIPQVGKWEKGLPSTENSKNKGTDLCKLRTQGCVTFCTCSWIFSRKGCTHVPLSPCQRQGLVCGVGRWWGAWWEVTTRDLNLPCLRHICSRWGRVWHNSSSRIHLPAGTSPQPDKEIHTRSRCTTRPLTLTVVTAAASFHKVPKGQFPATLISILATIFFLIVKTDPRKPGHMGCTHPAKKRELPGPSVHCSDKLSLNMYLSNRISSPMKGPWAASWIYFFKGIHIISNKEMIPPSLLKIHAFPTAREELLFSGHR